MGFAVRGIRGGFRVSRGACKLTIQEKSKDIKWLGWRWGEQFRTRSWGSENFEQERG